MKRMLSYVFALAVLSCGALAAAEQGREPAATNSAAAKQAGDVPLNPRVLMYSRSTLIDRLEWTGPAHKLPGTASDMHWHAWGADGALYVVDDDGENFGGRKPRCFFTGEHARCLQHDPPKGHERREKRCRDACAAINQQGNARRGEQRAACEGEDSARRDPIGDGLPSDGEVRVDEADDAKPERGDAERCASSGL